MITRLNVFQYMLIHQFLKGNEDGLDNGKVTMLKDSGSKGK